MIWLDNYYIKFDRRTLDKLYAWREYFFAREHSPIYNISVIAGFLLFIVLFFAFNWGYTIWWWTGGGEKIANYLKNERMIAKSQIRSDWTVDGF